MSKNKRQILNAILIFVIYGAEYFYVNFLAYGKRFISRTKISTEEIEAAFMDTSSGEKLYKQGIITKNEAFIDIVKNMIIRWGLESYQNTDDDIELFKHIYNCILGQIGYMFEIKSQIEENLEIEQETIDNVEDAVYHDVSKMIYHIMKSTDSEVD